MLINKSENHVAFFIEGCVLYELTGVDIDFDVISISEILWPDTDKLSDEEMITISKILNGEET